MLTIVAVHSLKIVGSRFLSSKCCFQYDRTVCNVELNGNGTVLNYRLKTAVIMVTQRAFTIWCGAQV